MGEKGVGLISILTLMMMYICFNLDIFDTYRMPSMAVDQKL